MNVLYISYDGMTDQLGQSQVLPYLQGIAAADYKVHLLSFEKKAHLEKEYTLIQSICDQSGITWHPTAYTSRPPVLSSIYDFMRMRAKAEQLHQEFNFRLVHCRSYLPGMTGMHLKLKYGINFLFDIRGFWADERVEGGLWNRKNPLFNSIYRFFKAREKEMFNTADGIISLTSKAVPVIRKLQEDRFKIKPLQVIPCCVDTNLFNPATLDPEQQRSIRNELGLQQEEFVLCYLGGIGTWYLAGEMFDFFKRLLLRYPNAKFLFITKENPNTLLKLAQERNIPAEKLVIQAAPRNKIPLYLSLADASLYFIMNSFSKQASSPTKQGEVMSMGLPLICNEGVGDSSQIVEESNTGYVCRSFTADNYDEIISKLRHPVTEEEKRRIRATAIQHFSLEDGIKAYLEMYGRLLQE